MIRKVNWEELFEFISGLRIPDGSLAEITSFMEHSADNLEQPKKENELKADLAKDGSVTGVEHDFLYAVVDQRHLVSDRPKRKWYTPSEKMGDRSGPSRLTKKRGICFHHTAVVGGFGAHRTVMKDFLTQVERGSDYGKYAQGNVIQINRELKPDELARVHALGGRYRGIGPANEYNNGVPYHVIRGPNSVLYLNLPFDWVTWHGDASNNDFLGYAWDALSTKDALEPDDMIQDIIFTADRMKAEGHTVEEFTGHCAYTRKPLDPGKHFIKEVMIPAAEKLGATIRMDFKSKPEAASIAEVLTGRAR